MPRRGRGYRRGERAKKRALTEAERVASAPAMGSRSPAQGRKATTPAQRYTRRPEGTSVASRPPQGLHPAGSADGHEEPNAPTNERTIIGSGSWAALRWSARREECQGTREGCKKMHFFCKKMQIYLHISKKSSTFVPALGIVPAITL